MLSSKKPRVGIMTFHRAANYGAVLQAYALRRTIEKLGADCEIIDYRSDTVEAPYKPYSLSNCRTPKDLLKYLLYAGSVNSKLGKFEDFLIRDTKLSTPCYSKEDLAQLSKQYDHVFCGSDQVWNYNITGFDGAYFLNFVDNQMKKNSYAASFGIDSIPEPQQETYRDLLKSFNHLSVREENAKVIIKDLTGKEAVTTLDPTLLLDQEEWSEISSGYRKDNGYILTYHFTLTDSMKSFIKDLSAKKGLKIVSLTHSIKNPLHAELAKDAGPSEFVGLFKNAEYVVTNSFHGTIFSLIFRKDFFLEMLPPPWKVNSRLINILNIFDLHSREILNGKNPDFDKPVDYNRVEERILAERAKSIEYLQNILVPSI